MPTILCLNNYDLTWHAASPLPQPAHLLYGIDHLRRAGHNILLGPKSQTRLFHSLQSAVRFARLPLGDLAEQWTAFGARFRADLIYSPCDSVVQGLCHLKAMGLIRIPIVALAHHPLGHGRFGRLRRPWNRSYLRGLDAFPSLSRGVADEINRLAPGRGLSRPLPWGPDLDFYPPYSPPSDSWVVSIGRTGRDFNVLGQAASAVGVPTKIVCPISYTNSEGRFGSNVSVHANINPMHYGYRQIIEFYTRASVVAIPMRRTFALCGLSSLLDALAMGRAVIMTRHPLIDLDIEREGIGLWVEPNDTSGWERALRYTADNQSETVAMGQRARLFSETRFTYNYFGEEICKIIERFL